VLDRAANLLVEASAVDMVNDAGAKIEVWTISSDGARVRASAPRLAVAEGMTLSGRVVSDGTPYVIRAVIEEAVYQSDRRAALVLRVTDAAADGGRRRSERVVFSGTAHVTALVCDRIVPGDRISARVSDLSTGGVGLLIADDRPRPGDRLRLYARFLEGVIETDVRVARTVSAGRGDGRAVGCEFVQLPVESARVVGALLERLGSAQVRPGTTIREDLAAAQPPDPAGSPRPVLSPRPLPSIG
jgi:hypothetical protein